MLDKLSSVQTEALRLCCGAAKGTAALALQNECGEMPIQNRRLQNWTNEFKTVANEKESIYTLTHSFFSSLNLTFLAPTFPASPPWLNKDVDIDISLKESVSKKNDNPELLCLMCLDHINRYNTHTHTHTHIYALMVLRQKI